LENRDRPVGIEQPKGTRETHLRFYLGSDEAIARRRRRPFVRLFHEQACGIDGCASCAVDAQQSRM
jgi:hypothetical protein